MAHDTKVVEDGAPVHRAKVAKSFRDNNLMESFPHPAQSPDMNPIEHVWYLMKRAINKRERKRENAMHPTVRFKVWYILWRVQ